MQVTARSKALAAAVASDQLKNRPVPDLAAVRSKFTPNRPVLVRVGKTVWPAHVIRLAKDGRICQVRFDNSGPDGEWVPTQNVQPVEEVAAATRRRIAAHYFAPV